MQGAGMRREVCSCMLRTLKQQLLSNAGTLQPTIALWCNVQRLKHWRKEDLQYRWHILTYSNSKRCYTRTESTCLTVSVTIASQWFVFTRTESTRLIVWRLFAIASDFLNRKWDAKWPTKWPFKVSSRFSRCSTAESSPSSGRVGRSMRYRHQVQTQW